MSSSIRVHRAGLLEQLRKRVDGQIGAADVDDVTLGGDADARARHEEGVVHGQGPTRAGRSPSRPPTCLLAVRPQAGSGSAARSTTCGRHRHIAAPGADLERAVLVEHLRKPCRPRARGPSCRPRSSRSSESFGLTLEAAVPRRDRGRCAEPAGMSFGVVKVPPGCWEPGVQLERQRRLPGSSTRRTRDRRCAARRGAGRPTRRSARPRRCSRPDAIRPRP